MRRPLILPIGMLAGCSELGRRLIIRRYRGGEVPGGLAWVMTISLYDLSVLTFLQTMRAVSGFLDRAAKHCAETGADPDDFVRARLYPDMAPFHFQIEA